MAHGTAAPGAAPAAAVLLLAWLQLGATQVRAFAACGEGIGDLRKEVHAKSACRQCVGIDAKLEYCDGCADPLGYTFCRLREPTQTSSAKCGEGSGDLRSATGGLQACLRCGGQGAELEYCKGCQNGLGYTFCHEAAARDLEAASRICAESQAQGEGDLRAQQTLVAACKGCLGKEAQLQFLPGGAAGGEGRTFCRVPDGKDIGVKPDYIALRSACGEGLGDVRRGAGAAEKCAACEGGAAQLDLFFSPSEGQWRTVCHKGRRLLLSTGPAAARDVGVNAEAAEAEARAVREAPQQPPPRRLLGVGPILLA